MAPAFVRYVRTPQLGWKPKVLLLFLRACAWGLLLTMALRPSRAVVHETAEKGKLIVLRDRSGSMAVADGRGGETRAGQMDAAWEKALAAAPEVGQLLELAEYDFGDRLAHNGADVGEATAVGDVLSSALRAERGAKLHGVILLSDGRNTAGRDPLPALAPYIEAGIPIHTAQFGRAEFAAGIVDAVVTDVLVPPVVEAGKPFPINISGLIRGAEGRSCQLECLVDDKRVADRRIQCETADEKVKQRLMLPAINEPGFYLVTLRLVPLPGEISPDNNEMQVFVRVKEEGIQVLYLEASINPQYKFLRRLISADEGFTLESPSPFYLRTKRGIAEVQGLDLSAYNVIILGGIAPETLTANQWRRLPSLVKNRGAGLLAIGSTFNDLLDDRLRPLQSILPVRANDSTLEHREFAPKVVGAQKSHFILGELDQLLGSRDFAWERLPGHGMRLRSLTARAMSEVLFVDQRNYPLLVTDQTGRGRVAAWTTPVTWTWRLNPETPKRLYDHLWMRTLYWLASQEDDMARRLSISAGTTYVRAGEPLEVIASATDENNVGIPNLAVALTITDLESSAVTSQPALPSGDSLVAALRLSTGIYSIRAQGEHRGQTLESNELRISVNASRIEDENLLADPALLQAISDRTGGQATSQAGLADLMADVPFGAKVVTVRRIASASPVWDNWWLLLALVLPLVAEWAIRRRVGFQ
ncbi:MAG TPA: hypothetical protein DCR55_08170 [Lentisphaeria bacterium]|nr:hypothetical protein [Lentisphaeria bacterium]